MSTETTTGIRPRIAALLFLLSVGAAGAVAVAVSSTHGPSGGKAKPAAQSPNGTGTVVGATPTSSPAAGKPASSPAPGAKPTASSSPGKPGDPGPSGVFSISGNVTGLVPGATKTLALTVSNPNPWPIQVLTLDTSVAAPAGSGCAAATLSVGSYTYASGGTVVTAPARGTVQVSVPVSYADSPTVDQTGCAAKTFPLTFTGTAVKTR